MHLDSLIERASRHVPAFTDGPQLAKPLPGLTLLSQGVEGPFDAGMYDPVLCLILQGAKEVAIGGRSLAFGPGECLLVSHDLPVRSRIAQAPYLALVFKVEVAAIRKLYDEVAPTAHSGEETHSAQTHRADPDLLGALHRYLALADDPAAAKVLGPLLQREIHYRLLTAPFGGMLRRLIHHGSNASAIARAIAHIRDNLGDPIEIPALASRVGMSTSSFHQHFKTITATTPLQYQKELRLLAARQLLQGGAASVATAAFEVGYESPSQFSREYTRKFGVPPSREMAGVVG